VSDDARPLLGAVFREHKLTTGARLVFMAMLTYVSHETWDGCFASVGTLAEVTGLDERNVHRGIRSLREAGLIVVTGTRRSPSGPVNVYSLDPARGGGGATPYDPRNSSGGIPDLSPRGGGIDARGGGGAGQGVAGAPPRTPERKGRGRARDADALRWATRKAKAAAPAASILAGCRSSSPACGRTT
jgi:DNA-binding transcriptional ArsR family regulator